MGIYNLTFDVLGRFGGEIPKLNIYYGGKKLAVKYAYSSNTPVSLEIDTDGFAYNHSLLRFYFVKGSGADGDSIEVSNIKLDSDALDINNFEEAKGGTVTNDSLVLGKGEYIDYDAQASGDITDTQYVAPQSGAKVQAVITGTAGDDRPLYGTNEAGGDVIDALAGNDKVIAADGNDTVNAGDGNDYVSGGNGDDILNGDAGNDKMYGGNGDDTLNGGTGTDKLYGNNGDDTINGGDDNDTLYGNEGQDTLDGGNGDDNISGGADNDILYGGAGNDQLFGGDGDDEMHGGDDNDRMLGNAGNDTMYGDAGDDNIDGQEGDDTIYGGNGSDTIDGEEGNDTLDGGSGNDFVIGGQGADILNGGNGNDVMYGGGISSYDQYVIRDTSAYGTSGVWFSEQTQSFYRFVTSGDNWRDSKIAAENAVLNGASGHLVSVNSQVELDFLLNFSGADSYWVDGGDYTNEGVWTTYSGADRGTQYHSEATGSGINNYDDLFAAGQPNSGGAENYAYLLSQGGGLGDAPVAGYTHSVGYIIEWDAEDVLSDTSTNTLNGESGDDILYGGSGADILNGGADDDRLYGNAGNDILNGDAGNDYLQGNSGNDTLNGGSGNDALYGGNQVYLNFVNISDARAYGSGQDGGGTVTRLDDGVGIGFDGNAWKYLEVNYNVTANTVVEFDFRSTIESEISGIGFDNDLEISSNLTFQVYGDQNWGINTYSNYDGSGDWTHYSINIGARYTGQFRFFTLVNDDDNQDNDNVDGNSWFRNIVIHEGDTGNNTLSGGAGADDLYGTGGTDTFVFEAASAFSNIDNIHNFTAADGDIIDLSDIITGFTGDITDHVDLVNSGDHSLLRVDADGSGGYTTIAEIRGGEGLDEASLYANGQIII